MSWPPAHSLSILIANLTRPKILVFVDRNALVVALKKRVGTFGHDKVRASVASEFSKYSKNRIGDHTIIIIIVIITLHGRLDFRLVQRNASAFDLPCTAGRLDLRPKRFWLHFYPSLVFFSAPLTFRPWPSPFNGG